MYGVSQPERARGSPRGSARTQVTERRRLPGWRKLPMVPFLMSMVHTGSLRKLLPAGGTHFLLLTNCDFVTLHMYQSWLSFNQHSPNHAAAFPTLASLWDDVYKFPPLQ